MLSHLRFHRRGHSNPTSPVPELPSSPVGGQPSSPFFPDALSPPDTRPQSSSSSALPPKLPPITRVTSADGDAELVDLRDLRLDHQQDVDVATPPQQQQPQPHPHPQPMPRSPYNGDSGFIGGVALRNYRRDMAAQAANRSDSSDYIVGNSGDSQAAAYGSRPPPSTTDTTTTAASRPPAQPLRQNKGTTSFVSPSEMHSNSAAPVGRRPAGTRLTSEQQVPWTGTTAVEAPKGKRGLPFLKNPMSTLLLRRKNNHNVPDLLPLPLSTPAEEPTYDPRIRGTRVHDFTTPRRKNIASSQESIVSKPPAKSDAAAAAAPSLSQSVDAVDAGLRDAGFQRRQTSNASDSAQSGSLSMASQSMMMSSSMSSDRTRFSLVDEPAMPNQAAPPVPPKDDVPTSTARRSNSQASFTKGADSVTFSKAHPSVRSIRTTHSTNRSLRSVSGMSTRDAMSALPRHMKSTSSRFSFDMIGAAKQEKLLEERHRQREAERQVTDPPGPRDSRYDEFDDDGFDYDAMMDDDGLEERIPGVNADYDDEEDDYFIEDDEVGHAGNINSMDGMNGMDNMSNMDNSYSNFVFQNSNPASSLASPNSAGILVTPRDAHGQVIGYAMTQETPRLQSFPNSPYNPITGEASPGLGIQGINMQAPKPIESSDTAGPTHTVPGDAVPTGPKSKTKDDLYFDDGLIGFEDEFAEELAAPPEWDAAPFDESIFDLNDTDQYGRPLPGAFAQAQNLRRAASQAQPKRDSDMTSRFSAQSGVTQSTAHTSMSVDPAQPQVAYEEKLDPIVSDAVPTAPAATGTVDASSAAAPLMAAYQAALAAAAHEAAASGKFERGGSPIQQEAGPQDGGSPKTPEKRMPVQDYEYENDEYSAAYEDMDDFELDDDAIIAEANASALANDSDGWYGQEFGFYANPMNQHHNLSGSSPSQSGNYGYANGGFFGPKGVDSLGRSTSGRIVCREPNLTPITERSEYSNRNSVMSNLGLPPWSPATQIQSPGLAQLAMMAERGDDQMSLSALLRLRSRAWGGSQPSISSSREGSPKSEHAPWGPNVGHGRKNSMFSNMSRDSDNASLSGSPTLTMGMSFLSSPPLPMGAPADNGNMMGMPKHGGRPDVGPQQIDTTFSSKPDHSAPLSAVSEVSTSETVSPTIPEKRPGIGHRHKGSADSISYTQEGDKGEKRWVMERRRTDEWGEVEILGREVVEGGRI
ncbi:hypothetical protein B0I35DRAFT_431057 [Stachybotrys elegans]|uniref:AGC-kinase C-terminal domain-containing protein n=1 Tax=Stachybotrys elegans TaxID=80388 RepID=A0A8K0WSW1_9HYPO|nr:hypothetical protein B0I35DRAFT_431057 [Stachybotrys elegans]